MSKDAIKEILYTMLAIVLIVLSIRFLIWMLPVILLLIGIYLVYRVIKKRELEKNVNVKKEKKIKVIHDFDDK